MRSYILFSSTMAPRESEREVGAATPGAGGKRYWVREVRRLGDIMPQRRRTAVARAREAWGDLLVRI